MQEVLLDSYRAKDMALEGTAGPGCSNTATEMQAIATTSRGRRRAARGCSPSTCRPRTFAAAAGCFTARSTQTRLR